MGKGIFSVALGFVVLLVPGLAKADSGLQFDSDVPPVLQTQVLGDLSFMESIVGHKQSPLHQEIFGTLDGANYLQWFEKHVYYFGVDSCGGGDSAVACEMAKYPHKIFVTSNYTDIDHPQIARLMTLYHEARHTEDEHYNWPHARCPLTFPYRSIWTGRSLRWSHACDSTAYGSYASASVLLNNISKFCENCTEKVKADAKLYSDDQVKRVINRSAIAALKADFAY